MSGGSNQQPTPGKTSQKDTSKSTTSQTGTTAATSTPTLPPWLSDMIQGQAINYGGTVDQFGNRIDDWQAAGFTPEQLQGFEMQKAAALGPQQSAIDQLSATARGDYLYGGPGFDAAVNAAYEAGVPRVTSVFGAAGRDDGGLGQEALARAFANPFAMQYGEERARQQAAQFGLPALSLLPGQTFQDIGRQQQALQQYSENYPLETLFPALFGAQQGVTQFASPFQGTAATGTSNVAGTTKSKGQQVGTNVPAFFPGSSTAGLLGGIATGAGIGGQFGGPWGAGIGALGGGLLSAFG